MPTRCINNFSPMGRRLGHVTVKIFGIQSKISSKQLKSETSNLVPSFVLGKPSGRKNNFSQKGPDLGHVNPNIFGTRSNISSKLVKPQSKFGMYVRDLLSYDRRLLTTADLLSYYLLTADRRPTC